MLTPDQVRPFLLHDDELVRERALVYFAEAADVSWLHADDLWAIVDRFGSRHAIYRALPTPATRQIQLSDSLKLLSNIGTLWNERCLKNLYLLYRWNFLKPLLLIQWLRSSFQKH